MRLLVVTVDRSGQALKVANPFIMKISAEMIKFKAVFSFTCNDKVTSL